MDETLYYCIACRHRDRCREAGLPLEVTADLMALLKVVSPERHPSLFVDAAGRWGVELSPSEVVAVCGLLERHLTLCPLSR